MHLSALLPFELIVVNEREESKHSTKLSTKQRVRYLFSVDLKLAAGQPYFCPFKLFFFLCQNLLFLSFRSVLIDSHYKRDCARTL